MQTIFASITSIYNGSIITIRISGPDALEICSYFKEKSALKPRMQTIKTIIKGEKIVDQALVTYFKAPNSYNGEEIVEISIHASLAVYKELIAILTNIKNFRAAEAGEFTKRAFMAGKVDLLQAEAVNDLIKSQTSKQKDQALKQLLGKNSQKYDYWRQQIIEIQTLIEAYIDFPDEDIDIREIEKFKNLLEGLGKDVKNNLADKHIGELIKEGFKITIIGPPNSGKSTLLNYFSKEDTAIISDIEGTTRDAIDICLDIEGFPVIITDTAGIRSSKDKIENIGIEKAKKKAKEAELTIILISHDSLDKLADFSEIKSQESMIFVNKIDLLKKDQLKKLEQEYPDCHFISLKENHALDKVEDQIKKILKEKFTNEDTIITNQRHRKLLEEIDEIITKIDFSEEIEIIAENLRLAANRLGQIIGKIDVEEILGNIFSNFCIGK